ncbi:MAG: 3-oxoacyl-(acyl-carrier-protein) synthase [Clostridiales bacterium]|jgi:3-oxoacyl-[acyl-carrier-protein] synthase-3|nr:3-oxoacyl-(acyl-carrier-protein) synthase [Clostridiales bacterium]
MYGVRLDGLGKSIPNLDITNEYLATMVETSDEWIQTRTGIKSRRIAVEESTTSLAINAAKQALENSGLEPKDIELVIVATVSPDMAMPSTACVVAENLQIENAICFDLTAACSGFIYASEVATSFIKLGNYKNALVIGAEVLSKMVDWQDRGTCILFADGAGAAIYKRSDENNIIGFSNKSDGKGSQLIRLANIPHSNSFSKAEEVERHIQMDGQAVYKFATTAVPKNIIELLEKENYRLEDVDWFVLHQANARIIDSVAKRLKVSLDKFFMNVSEYGNTSAASIPIALYDAKHLFKKGDKIILSGFGAGLTWGSMLLIWG